MTGQEIHERLLKNGITPSTVFHKGEKRIKLEFNNNSFFNEAVRKVNGSKWSATMKAWHISHDKQLLEGLIESLEIKNKQDENIKQNDHESNIEIFKKNINVDVYSRKIIIKCPKNDIDTKFLIGIRFSRWDRKNFNWVIPNYPGNLEVIKEYFKERISSTKIHESTELNDSKLFRQVGKEEIIVIKTKNGRLKLIFLFNKKLSYLVNKFPYHYWDSKNKWYTIPFSEKYLQEIKEIAHAENFKIIYEEEKVDASSRKKIKKDLTTYKKCPEEYILKLKELRYSESTIKTYKSSFTEFINYYHNKELDKIDELLIIEYLRYLVIECKVSSSYQNQAINSIKFYYERVLGGQRKFYLLDRPREEKTLPVVLSEKEILALLKSIENIKHKLILMVTYSAGLRVSEVVNLKIKDIDKERMQIRVEQSKGKKDRYTLLANTLLNELNKYMGKYEPVLWLFEGQNGEQYSVRSILEFPRKVTH